MQLREGEQILKIFYPHVTPFVFYMLKVFVGIIPLFVFLFLVSFAIPKKWQIIGHTVLGIIFVLVVIYKSLVYWLDRLIVTNLRIVHVEWRHLTVRDEAEARIEDIQDIQTQEKGILSYFRIFDYGIIRMDTASSYTTIEFKNAPDPEGIRRFIYNVRNQ